MLAARDLTLTRGRREVLSGVSLAVDAGECVGLIGPNGAGKTTLLRACAGLAAPAGGSLTLGGAAIGALPPAERARRVAYLPQGREVAWPLPVEAVVALGRLPHLPPGARPGPADRAAVAAAMAAMDVGGLRGRAVTALSGGERARVLIARALAQEAPLLLADEPVAGLDPAHQIAAMECFAGLAAAGRAVLVSLHELGLAARWCTRLVLLHDGRVAADDAPAAVLTEERLAQVYGIRAYRRETAEGLVLMPLAREGRA